MLRLLSGVATDALPAEVVTSRASRPASVPSDEPVFSVRSFDPTPSLALPSKSYAAVRVAAWDMLGISNAVAMRADRVVVLIVLFICFLSVICISGYFLW